MGAVANYCDKYVCPQGYLRNYMRDLYQLFLCMLPISMILGTSLGQSKI